VRGYILPIYFYGDNILMLSFFYYNYKLIIFDALFSVYSRLTFITGHWLILFKETTV